MNYRFAIDGKHFEIDLDAVRKIASEYKESHLGAKFVDALSSHLDKLHGVEHPSSENRAAANEDFAQAIHAVIEDGLQRASASIPSIRRAASSLPVKAETERAITRRMFVEQTLTAGGAAAMGNGGVILTLRGLLGQKKHSESLAKEGLTAVERVKLEKAKDWAAGEYDAGLFAIVSSAELIKARIMPEENMAGSLIDRIGHHIDVWHGKGTAPQR